MGRQARRAEDQIDLLGRELDVLQREYQIRAAAMYADAGNRMRNSADWDKQDAQYKQQIADKQKALDDAKQKLEDMQEDARKAGVPARSASRRYRGSRTNERRSNLRRSFLLSGFARERPATAGGTPALLFLARRSNWWICLTWCRPCTRWNFLHCAPMSGPRIGWSSTCGRASELLLAARHDIIHLGDLGSNLRPSPFPEAARAGRATGGASLPDGK